MLKTSNRNIFIIISLFWILPGVKIFSKGLYYNYNISSSFSLEMLLISFFIFIAFQFVFLDKSFRRTCNHIAKKGDAKISVFRMFNLTSWVFLITMITLGISIVYFGIFSDRFIAEFYVGLGAGLVVTGIKFFIKSRQFKNQ